MFVSEFSRSRKFVLFDGLVVCVLRLLVENTKGLDWIEFACEISKSLSDLNDRMLVKWGSYRTRIVFLFFSLISVENWTFDRLGLGREDEEVFLGRIGGKKCNKKEFFYYYYYINFIYFFI